MIDYIRFDMLNIEHNAVLAHGCNNLGIWGAGIARQFKEMYPDAFAQYYALCKRHRPDLGTTQFLQLNDDRSDCLWVANLFTQETIGRSGIHAKPWAIESALQTCMEFARENDLPVYMPKIGCGLGGLSWEYDVEPIVQRISKIHHPGVFVCEL